MPNTKKIWQLATELFHWWQHVLGKLPQARPSLSLCRRSRTLLISLQGTLRSLDGKHFTGKNYIMQTHAFTCHRSFINWNAFAVNQLSLNWDCPISFPACSKLIGSVYNISAIWRICLILLSCLENGSRGDETNWMVIMGGMGFAFQCRRHNRHLLQRKKNRQNLYNFQILLSLTKQLQHQIVKYKLTLVLLTTPNTFLWQECRKYSPWARLILPNTLIWPAKSIEHCNLDLACQSAPRSPYLCNFTESNTSKWEWE